MEATDEQRAIIEYVRAGKGDLLINALAGSGKTWTLLKALEVIPQKSALLCAFNKRIQGELSEKIKLVPRRKGHIVNVKTFHSIGLSIIQSYFPKIEIDGDATETLVSQAIDRHGKAINKVSRAAVRLVKTYKEAIFTPKLGHFPIDPEDMEALGHEFDLFDGFDGRQIEQAVELAITAYDIGTGPQTKIDFCDMIWLPLANDLAPKSRYQAVIVDEWQDLSRPQMALLERVVAPGGRMIMAGDIHQAIYAWRGGVGKDIAEIMVGSRKAKQLSLRQTFRCPKVVVRLAAEIVKDFRCSHDAEDGSIRTIGYADMPRAIAQPISDKIHTFVLSRNNADLLDCAMMLWREGVKFQLNAGKEMLQPMFYLLDYVLKGDTHEKFTSSLKAWMAQEIAKAERVNAVSRVTRVTEMASMITKALAHVERPSQIKGLLQEIIEAGRSGVLLSTVHKVKGLEAERVFLLRQTFARHRVKTWEGPDGVGKMTQFEAFDQEEWNIEYVAITRTRDHLTWVNLDCREPMSFVVEGYPFGGGSPTALTIDQLEAVISEVEDECVRLDTAGFLERSKELGTRRIELVQALNAARAK